ncbi:MAG: type II and III secretion system protein family protein [Marivibrio sp.]|uniref:type II and III secretion system protein family protein n=1 Tax=Marivibrio sp. TaxID=2039719 RepID=UPI0032EBAFB9
MSPRSTVRTALAALALALADPIGPSAAAQEALFLEVGGGRMVSLSRPASAVYVANPEIADVELKSPRLVYLFAKRTGETAIYAVDRAEETVVDRRVVVEHGLTRLRELIAQVRPGAQVQVASLNNSLVLTGLVESAEAAEDVTSLAEQLIGEEGAVLNRLKIATPHQVNLRVRIAEVSRDIAKQLGFSWDVLRNIGDFTLGLSTGAFIDGATSGSAVGSFGYDGSGLDVNSIVDALDDQGLITVLAEPNLTALSGETANFLAGGEFPIPVPQDNETLTVAYREFGVSLGFMPVVLDDGQLQITVRSEVSQLSAAGAVAFAGFNVPALTTRRAETTVTLGSGQSFAIAGLLQNTTNQNVSRIPGLGDIPVLGALFRSNEFQREESELVVIVTPYVVRPSNGRLAAPTDGFIAPSDGVRNMTGAAYEQRLPDAAAQPLGVDGREGGVGPAGFILR